MTTQKKGLSTTEWQQEISPYTSCATSTSGDAWLPAKKLNRRLTWRLDKHPWETEKVRWLPRVQGENKHKPIMEVWDWQVCCLCWFQIYTGQTDRQTISYGALSGESHPPSATFKFPLALKPNSAPCDKSEWATIPSSVKDRSRVGGWVDLRRKGSPKHKMIHEQDRIEQLKKNNKKEKQRKKKEKYRISITLYEIPVGQTSLYEYFTGCVFFCLPPPLWWRRRAGSGREEGWKGWGAVVAAPPRPPGGVAGTHYLREGIWSPLIWGGTLKRSSSSWAKREKWSEGMWGCGQPLTLFSTSQWGSRGPKMPSTFRWGLE